MAAKVKDGYGNADFYDFLDDLSYEEGICIDIEKNGYNAYRSFSFNRGCMIPGKVFYKNDFPESNEEVKAYKIDNPKFNNEILVYGVKLDTKTFAYVSASIEPLDSATVLLRKQFIIISLFALGLAVLVSYVLSKQISKPIEELSKKASNISQGDHQVAFSSDTNIREIQQLETSLNEMHGEFEKTEELRRDLMANVSHDLKTPLTMIRAYAEMVRDLTYKNKKKREENLNVIVEETERLSNLVDDILTLSSLQSESVELEDTTFSIHDMIVSTIQKYEVLLEKEGYHFHYEGKEVLVFADKKRTEQVIYNIINNAINYTGDDKNIYIRLLENKDTVRIEIEDTGKGISEEEKKHIWTKYYHSSKQHKRNRVGTGLGLAIVKNILDNYHLPYGIESKDKNGTIFYFELKKGNK